MAVVTTGITVSWQSGFFAEILNFRWGGISREVISTSNASTTGFHTKIPSTLLNGGQVEVELIFDPELDWTAAMSAAAEAVVVTYADPAPASTDSFSAFASGFQIEGPLEDKMTATVTLETTGTVTHG